MKLTILETKTLALVALIPEVPAVNVARLPVFTRSPSFCGFTTASNNARQVGRTVSIFNPAFFNVMPAPLASIPNQLGQATLLKLIGVIN